jgi:hypothetical protein
MGSIVELLAQDKPPWGTSGVGSQSASVTSTARNTGTECRSWELSNAADYGIEKSVRTGPKPDPHVLGILRMCNCNRCKEPHQAQSNEWNRHV